MTSEVVGYSQDLCKAHKQSLGKVGDMRVRAKGELHYAFAHTQQNTKTIIG